MKTNTQHKNIEINFIRLFFAIMIFLFHTKKLNNGVPVVFGYGYIAVEFFFILNGYFMYESILRNEKTTQDYVLTKFKNLYSIYISAFVVAFISRNIIFKANGISLLKNLALSVFEIIPIHMFGIPIKYGYNGPTWYVSSMLIGFAIVYPLLKKYFTKNIVYAFMLSITCYAILLQNVKTVDIANTWWYITYLGNVRAIAGLCLGICSNYLVKHINHIIKIKICAFSNLIKILSLGFIIVYTHFYKVVGMNKTYDPVCITCIFVLVTCVFLSDTKLRNNESIIKLSELSNRLSVLLYFSHRCIIFQLVKYVEIYSFRKLFFLYSCGTVVSMILTYLINRAITILVKNIKGSSKTNVVQQ